MEQKSKKSLIYDLSDSDLLEFIQTHNQPDYRLNQIKTGLYQKYINRPDAFTNLPLEFRNDLGNFVDFSHLTPVISLQSNDGETRKTLFSLPDGNTIETVLMGYKTRQTVCISSQAECAMGCIFCATGQIGFGRNLSCGEIIEQVIYYARLLSSNNEKISNVVIMGMGEPFHNYDATILAIDLMNQPDGMNIGARRFTISTVGIIPMIRRFTKENRQVNLAVSLHAADDGLRSKLIPINKKYPLDELMIACKDYVEVTHRRISFEWALIRDVNDSPEQARLLAKRVHNLLCHVNIIPLNPTTKYSGRSTTQNRAKDFQAILAQHGIPCTIRLRRGIDIQAGCGQLAGNAHTLLNQFQIHS